MRFQKIESTRICFGLVSFFCRFVSKLKPESGQIEQPHFRETKTNNQIRETETRLHETTQKPRLIQQTSSSSLLTTVRQKKGRKKKILRLLVPKWYRCRFYLPVFDMLFVLKFSPRLLFWFQSKSEFTYNLDEQYKSTINDFSKHPPLPPSTTPFFIVKIENFDVYRIVALMAPAGKYVTTLIAKSQLQVGRQVGRQVYMTNDVTYTSEIFLLNYEIMGEQEGKNALVYRPVSSNAAPSPFNATMVGTQYLPSKLTYVTFVGTARSMSMSHVLKYLSIFSAQQEFKKNFKIFHYNVCNNLIMTKYLPIRNFRNSSERKRSPGSRTTIYY